MNRDKVELVKKLRAEGKTYKQIQVEVGVSSGFVWSVLNPRSYREYQEKHCRRKTTRKNNAKGGDYIRSLKQQSKGTFSDLDLEMALS